MIRRGRHMIFPASYDRDQFTPEQEAQMDEMQAKAEGTWGQGSPSSRAWLEHLDRGVLPDDPRQAEQLQALRRLGLVQPAPSIALTAKGRDTLDSWQERAA